MPRRFLSQAERERLSQFPTDVSENDLIVYFSLTTADKEAIFEQRTSHAQLGFALLLCVLRYLGFFPTELGQVPEGVVGYVAQQLDISPENLTPYLERSENRVAASLKFRWVTASTLISKLQAGPHKLTHLLQEYGRLVKTIFIAHYLVDEPYRRRILRQLNKSEAVHRLRRFLFFDNQGQLRQRYHEDFVNQAGCLNLLSNAIIVWNTVYMQAALDELVKREFPVREDDLAHLSPIRFRHINPYGKFQFELISDLTPAGLRPLRSD